MWKKCTAPLIGLGLLLATAGSSFAAGFALIEQSVSGLGNAFAGGAASAEDATTVFFNPAGMMLLEGQEVTSALHVIMPSTKFTAEQAPTNALTGPIRDSNSLPMTAGSSGGDGGVTGIAPNFYYVNRLSEKMAIGLGINAPFGLATKYDKTWIGRYHAVESDVMTININPSIAYRATEKLSIGAGFNAQYIEATLSSMIDFGLKAAILNPALAATPVPSNPNADVFSELNADDWSFGYNLGLLYEFTPETRMGFAYRSKIKHKLEGDAKFNIQNPTWLSNVDPALLAMAQATFVKQGAYGSIELPASASLSYFHQATPELAIMADITWTEWSSFDSLVMNFEGTLADSPSITTENWDDTWRYSIGATYQLNEKLVLRAGVAFDETPISDEHRTPRIPGEDRTWVSLGCGYQFTDKLSMDVAYAHLFVSDSKMEKYATDEGADDEDLARGTVVGEFENAVDIASIQLSYKF
ncbi:long-chain fatty acid transport protein [Malonomonas rubra DSM 5091]|uniref:Long-chain fatty acid transport protein n=1 Tax=Malonomonas rubra DSM 5091 TaxID=1122189 RepID=A0A1M6HEY2_MALRU|nr:outer membrane protein transport protein [Malonomonas rubra]SHJ20772.1 long-chain fatty acid transport protein [Malonomonas rubra DSM 5091]